MSFSNLGLTPELMRAVADKGYATPTPIQREAIPAVLAGRDVLAGAQTGTGKTAAFVLPILQKLAAPGAGAPRALVLTPTRELAAQVAASAEDYGRFVRLRTLVIFGGVSEKPQIQALRAAATCWSRPRAGCSTLRSSACSTCPRCAAWCSMRPTACSTWASSPRSARS